MWKAISVYRVSLPVPALCLHQLQMQLQAQRNFSLIETNHSENETIQSENETRHPENETHHSEIETHHSENQEVFANNSLLSRIKILIPGWATPNVLPRNFEALRDEHTTDLKIRASNPGEYFPGQRERVVMIEGPSQSDVNSIVHKLSQLLRTMDLPEALNEKQIEGAMLRRESVNLIVPKELVGKLIGRNGTRRRKIQEKFELNTFVIEDRDHLHNSDLNERFISLRGNEANVEMAANYIMDMVHEDADHSLCDNLAYKKYSESLSSWTRLKVLVPFYMLPIRNWNREKEGTIFGRMRKGVMEKEFGIKFYYSRFDYPGTKERTVLLEGPHASVMQALEWISNQLRSSGPPRYLYKGNDRSVALKKHKKCLMLIHNNDELAKCFGNKEQIDIFSEDHGIKIDIMWKRQSSETPANESVVFIEGEEKSVLGAIEKLSKSMNHKVLDTDLDYTKRSEFYIKL